MVQTATQVEVKSFPLFSQIMLVLKAKFGNKVRTTTLDLDDSVAWQVELFFTNFGWRTIWFTCQYKIGGSVQESGSFFLHPSLEYTVKSMIVVPPNSESVNETDLLRHPFNKCLAQLVVNQKGHYIYINR